jgi:hypothetical protein
LGDDAATRIPKLQLAVVETPDVEAIFVDSAVVAPAE